MACTNDTIMKPKIDKAQIGVEIIANAMGPENAVSMVGVQEGLGNVSQDTRKLRRFCLK